MVARRFRRRPWVGVTRAATLLAVALLRFGLAVHADEAPPAPDDAAVPAVDVSAGAPGAGKAVAVDLPDALAALTNAVVATGDEGPIVPPRAFWFPVGEELVYSVHWGFIPVGEARVWSEWVRVNGRVLLALRFHTRSNKAIATIYPVNDRLETLVDPTTFLPVRFEKNMSEGRNRYHEVTVFDHASLTAHWTSLIKKKSKVFALEPDTRDLATFMYHIRSRPFQKGEKQQHRVMADDKIYDLFLNVADVENVKLDDFGRISCHRIEPDAKFDGLFVRKGKMTIWVSRDARCISTRIAASVPVADIKIILRAVRGPGDDEWVRRSPK